MNYLSEIAAVALIHFLALMSPGPDFIVVTKNSLVHSRKSGIYTAFGLSAGLLLHITYSLVGLGLIIERSIIVFSVMKFLGAGYLFYIGYRSLRAKPPVVQEEVVHSENHLQPSKAIKTGFLTNATNPKVTLFFLSVFTLVIGPQTPLYVKLIMGGEMILATFIWFSFISIVVSHRLVRNKMGAFQHYAEKVMGAFLVALGIELALSTRK